MIKSIETVNAYMIIIPKTEIPNRKRSVTVKFSLKILNRQLFYIEREFFKVILSGNAALACIGCVNIQAW